LPVFAFQAHSSTTSSESQRREPPNPIELTAGGEAANQPQSSGEHVMPHDQSG
jgi:hypothetical protein